MVVMEGDIHYAVSGDQLEAADGYDQDGQIKLEHFWNEVVEDIQKLTSKDFKEMELPIARIKKIMKLDEDVKMIAAETPVVFAKAAEIFIKELTLRAWIMTEESKRRTLQRNDISAAAGKCEMFDFLIDVLPREDTKSARRAQNTTQTSAAQSSTALYTPQASAQIENSTAMAIPAVGGSDQMQQVVIQLPSSVLSALSPQKQAGLTLMQPMALSGGVGQPQQLSVAEDAAGITADGSQVFAIGGSDSSGNIIQLSASQLQSLLQPAALKQPTQQ